MFVIHLAFFISLLLPFGVGVIVYVEAPKLVLAGTRVTLICEYDLQGEELHSVKWYREHYEFYRYIPEHNPPALAFPSSGIAVDLLGSNANKLTIQNIRKNLSGNFVCEVSADGPKFITACDSTNITVTEMQIRKPQLKLSSSVYRRSSPMSINCSSQVTKPPPKISFFLNDNRVEKRWVKQLEEGLTSLSVEALEDAILNDEIFVSLIWIRCEAQLPGIYHLSSASVPIIPQLVSIELSSAKNLQAPWVLLVAPLSLVIRESF